MKLKTILFLGCMLLVSSMAFAQGFAVGMFYDPTVTPLTNQCGSGDILPDGTTVEIFWDDNSNGPDPTDALLPLDHPSQPNFNTFPLNTGAFGFPGGFILDPLFSCAVAVPVPPRFWIRICVPDSQRHYRSEIWTVQPGLNPDIVFSLITNLADSATVDNAIWCINEGCGGCLAPPPVSGLVVSENRCDGINLTWNSYSGQPLVTELRVYRDAVTGTPLATLVPSATSYLDTGAPTGTSTYYLVAHKVCSPADGDTANSSNVSASGIRVAAPATPTITGATDNLCGSVQISWTNAVSLGSTDTMRVLRNGVMVGQAEPTGAGQPQTFTHSTSEAGIAPYQVVGWNASCGNGTPSASDNGEARQAPVQVTGVTASNGQCTVSINWTLVPNADDYQIYRGGTLLGSDPDDVPPYIDTPPLIDTPYAYTVRARRLTNPTGCQDGPQSASANGSRIGPPNVPSGVVASDTICTHVRVTWVDNSNNETGFIVRRGTTHLDTVGAGVLTFNDSTGLAGTTYSYSVLSLNDCGPSASSNTDNGVKLAALGQVTGVGATDNLPDRVTVTWNNIASETGYRIFRNAVSLNTVAADITTYHDMTAAPGVVYGYRVAAMNQCGDGTVSAVDSGRVFATIDPPTSVQASTSLPTHVALTWDNVDDETGYKILRDNMQATLQVDTLATLPVNSTSYNDSTGTPGVWYLYSVMSYNASSSAVSQPDSGRKLGVPAAPVLTQTLIHCDTVFYSWTSDVETDTVVFFLDGVEVATSLAQSGDRYQILPDAAAHTIQAEGANEAGRSAFSNTLNVATDTGPDAPFNVVGSSTDCETVVLGWADPEGADSIRIYRDGALVVVLGMNFEGYTDIVGYGPATYSYYLVAENECGDSPNSDTIQVTVGEPPSIPTNVTASDSLCDGVSVSWSASTGDVDGYDIYRDDVLVGSVAGDVLQYTDQPLDNVDHTYTVVAVSTECDDSAPSAGYTGHEVAAAEVPTGLTQTQPESCDSIEVCWTSGGGDVDFFKVYVDGVELATTTETCFTFEPTEGAGTYPVSVSAVSDECGESALSGSIDAILFETPGIVNLTASGNRCDGVDLMWDADGFSNLDGYDIYRNDALIASVASVAVSYFDGGASVGSNHYALIAKSSAPACGNSDSVTTDGVVLPLPTAPLNVVATDTSCSNVYVTWEDASGTYVGYTIFRDTDSIGFVGLSVLEFTDTEISSGATASYMVKAYDPVCGYSPDSNTDDGTRLLGPNPPTGVAATDNDCNAITVTWIASTGDVTQYILYRDGLPIDTVDASQLQYSDDVDAGTYTYTVAALSTNCGLTNQSTGDLGTRLFTMTQITGVVASVDSCQGILVSWPAMDGAESYNIYKDGGASIFVSIVAPDVSYMDNSVAEGELHSYTVTAQNTCNEGTQSDPASGMRAQTPGQVTGLTATLNLINQICLAWTDVDGELGYNVYRDDVFYANVSADQTDYCDILAAPGVSYEYRVAATNVCGEGAVSDSAVGIAVFNLDQVTGVVATTTNCNEICITWNDIDFETSYEVLRNGSVIASTSANDTDYCDTTPAPGECFDYTVRGVNEGGAGQSSAEVNGCRRTVPQGTPVLTASSSDCNAAILNWSDVTDEDSYEIYRNDALLTTVGANVLTYSDLTGVHGTLYNYKVRGVNACGNGNFSNTASGGIADVPATVTDVVASTDQCYQITISWTDVTFETGYYVYRDGNTTTPIATLGADVLTYVDNTVTLAHTYQVRAFNTCGNGLVSSAANGLALTVPGQTAAPSVVLDCRTIHVSWTPPALGPIQTYHVLRNNVEVGTVPAGTTSYDDTNLNPGTYSYKILVSNQCGDGIASSPSQSLTVIPPLVTVGNFNAAATSCFCINITWSDVQNETGYNIYCDGGVVATVNANITSYEYCPADTANCLVQVAAFNGCETGPLSTGISVTPNTYPVAVIGFAASENLCDRVHLSWSPYSAPGVSLLKIWRNSQPLLNISAGSTEYNHMGLWPASIYAITAMRVCAPGDTIHSAISSDAGLTAPTPQEPVVVSASDDVCGSVIVSFMFASGAGLDAVHIKRNGIVIGDLPGTPVGEGRTFEVPCEPGPAASYAVCGYSNICGEGECGVDVGQCAPTAGAVTGLTASNDLCTTVHLEWTGTLYATAYEISRDGSLIATVAQGTTSYNDNNLPTGVCHAYRVRAVNACGPGPDTQPAQGCTVPLPPVPTGVGASDGLCNEVIVSWNAVGVATGYNVYRDGEPINEQLIPGVFHVFVDEDVQPGVVYDYQVQGVNQCGEGALSQATTGFSAQIVPTVQNLAASTNLNDRVHLSWNNVVQETGYEILRGFPPEVIGSVGIDVTQYDDFSAVPGEEYEYYVRALNGCGTGQMSALVYGYRVPVDPIPFGVITITEELFGCMSAEVFDGDDDGDADILAAGMFADKIIAYENNGTWGYTPHVILEDWDGARSVAVGDIDGDGDDDAAAVAQFADELIWIQGNGTLNPVIHSVATGYDGARDVIIVDIDGDNDMDLVTAACDENNIAWWRNNGSEIFTRFNVDQNFIGARTVETADIGSDGDLDILASAFEGGEIAWYENNGNEVFAKHVLLEDAFGASYVNAADLNEDGVLDIYFCVAQDPLIAWWDGATMEQNYITSLLQFPRELDAADMDLDGRPDLLVAANVPQEISWWRNTDNRFYRNVMTNTMAQASVVHGGDFDNDGDTDVLGAGEGTIKLWLSALSDDVTPEMIQMPRPDDGDQPTAGVVVPETFELSTNWPNPFNPMTQIKFGLPEASSVRLTVYDIMGREVARIADGSFGAGYHTVVFDGSGFASGVYIYRIEAGSFQYSRKMMLMK